MALPVEGDGSQVLVLSDFTAGIYSNGMYATNVPPAPQGAAQEANTYRCIGLPGGGLAPLPKRTTNYNIPWPGTGTTAHIVGLQAASAALVDSSTPYLELVNVILDVNTSPRRLYWRTVVHSTAAWTSIQWANNRYSGTVDAVGGTDFISLTSAAIQPIGVGGGFLPIRIDSGFQTLERQVMFSSPLAATLNGSVPRVWIHGVADATPYYAQFENGGEGIVFEHQGRQISFAQALVGYLSATIEYMRSSGLAYYNAFWYSPETELYDRTADELQIPTGGALGSWGSVSVSELVLIGQGPGDSVHIQGDLDQPTITILRGVQPTGHLICRGLPTSMGLLYPSEKNGVWAWTGESGSAKISSQIRDNFFERTTVTTFPNNGLLIGESLIPAVWGKYVLYPHNWLLDTETSAWWRLEDAATKDLECWTSCSPRYAYGTVDSIASGATGTLCRFDLDAPATSYSFQSQPIAVSPHGRMVEVFDVEVKAVPSVANTDQTVTITFTMDDGTTQVETLTIRSTTTIPVRKRKSTHMRGYDVIVRVEADGGANPAPTIHHVSLGWRPTTPTAA